MRLRTLTCTADVSWNVRCKKRKKKKKRKMKLSPHEIFFCTHSSLYGGQKVLAPQQISASCFNFYRTEYEIKFYGTEYADRNRW